MRQAQKYFLFIHHKYFFRFVSLCVLLLLTACGGGQKKVAISSAYSNYMSSHPEWKPPGPDLDPWGPYINQSSQRFNVPDQWIRAIMVQESRGYQYFKNRPVTSPHGAKGLMQLKTPTYKDMAKRYKLGSDPYEPHDNIMAGTAYIKILYNKYGAPGFVAAYHGGPGTLDAHLKRGVSLPTATRNYLAQVSPKLGRDVPMSGPFASYGGGRNTAKPLSLEAYYHPQSYEPTTMVAKATNIPSKHGKKIVVGQYERVIASSSSNEPPIMIVPTAYKTTNTGGSGKVTVNNPNIVPVSYQPVKKTAKVSYVANNVSSSGHCGIQVGAFSSSALAKNTTNRAKNIASNTLSSAYSSIEAIQRNGSTLYRAKLMGVSQTSAISACQQLKQKGMSCVVIQ